MKSAVIGWGSLIWHKCDLRIIGAWQTGVADSIMPFQGKKSWGRFYPGRRSPTRIAGLSDSGLSARAWESPV